MSALDDSRLEKKLSNLPSEREQEQEREREQRTKKEREREGKREDFKQVSHVGQVSNGRENRSTQRV